MRAEVKITAEQYKKRKKRYRITKVILMVLLLILLLAYILFTFIYNGYSFTVSLDKNLYYDNDIIIYDSKDYKVYRQKLVVESLDYFDNISYRWLPNDLDNYDGSHNGENYLAYSFYIENMGEEVADYWSEIVIDDVIKNVDEAIRMRVYYDGEATTYAKLSSNGRPEVNTEPFYSEDRIMVQHVENFKPGDIHKYTIVMWLEGNDIDCNNNIIGGEFKAHMVFNSEFVDEGEKK